MSFTKINAAGIGSTETITVNGLTVVGEGSFGGNVSVAGTLTYEDVTNIDSVGLITARDGISVTGGGIAVGSNITLSAGGNIFAAGISTIGNVEDGKGNLRRYYLSGSTRIYKDSAAGIVNYSTGLITINAFILTSTVNADTSIDFTVIPSGNDVVAERGNLIDISMDDVKVTGEVDTIASGESSAGVGYTSTSTSSY